MKTTIEDLTRALQLLIRPALWTSLFQMLFQVRTLLFIIAAAVTLSIALAIGIAFSLGSRPEGLAVLPVWLWIWWFAPTVTRALGIHVASVAIEPQLAAREHVPEGVHAGQAPATAEYRRWFLWPLVGIAMLDVLRRSIGWTGSGSVVPLAAIGMLLQSRFWLRSALCPYFPLEVVNRSLKGDTAAWSATALVIGYSSSLVMAAVDALLASGGGLHALAAGIVTSLCVAATQAVLSSVSAARLLRELQQATPHQGDRQARAIHTPVADASIRPRRTSERKAETKPTSRWRVAGVCAILVVTGWVLLGKHITYAVLSFDNDFAEAVRFGAWSHESGHRSARTAMACANKRHAVLMLYAAGITRDADGASGLACAARSGNIDMARLLLWLGDDIDRLSPVSNETHRHSLAVTPLTHAILSLNLEIAEWLLVHGAKVDHASTSQLVESLMDQELKPDRARLDGPAAAHVAAARGCLPCLELLHRHRADLNNPVPSTPFTFWIEGRSRHQDAATLERLAALGMTPQATGQDGRSALHAAAAIANLGAVDWLMARGADPSTRDGRGMTPLMHAGEPYQIPFFVYDDYGLQRDAKQSTDQSERLEVILRLLPATPVLTGTVKASIERRELLFLRRPSGGTPGWSLGVLAAREATFRTAARAEGKSIDYSAPETWNHIRPEAQLQALGEMSDGEFASAIVVKQPGDENTFRLSPVSDTASSHGWVQIMERAARLGLMRPTLYSPCRTLLAAAKGVHDRSPDRVDSWKVVRLLLEAGQAPRLCSPHDRRELHVAVAARSALQQADWAARVALISTDTSTR